MALTTFVDAWRDLQLMAPNLPVPIAQRLVNNAYVRALDQTRWSSLRGQSEFFVPIGETTGSADVNNASAVVTGNGTAWTSALVGRQFFVNDEAPFYTVESVQGATQLTLDRPYGGLDGLSQPYSVQLLYLPVPSDFLHFIDIVDVENQWRLYHNLTTEEVDLFDPARTVSEMPWLFAQVQPTSLGGKPRYEIYPRPDITSAWSYPFRYQRRIPEMSANTDLPVVPIRMQTLREGALAELARWPGTSDRPNAYFSLDLSAFHEKQFTEALARDMRQDQEINQTDIDYAGPWGQWPWAPFSAGFMQSHLFPAWYSTVAAF